MCIPKRILDVFVLGAFGEEQHTLTARALTGMAVSDPTRAVAKIPLAPRTAHQNGFVHLDFPDDGDAEDAIAVPIHHGDHRAVIGAVASILASNKLCVVDGVESRAFLLPGMADMGTGDAKAVRHVEQIRFKLSRNVQADRRN